VDARVPRGQDLSTVDGRLVLQVRVAVRGYAVTPLDRFTLDDLHGTDGARVIVWHAGLTGKPGHNQQIVGFPHDNRNPIVVSRGWLNVVRHVGRSQSNALHGVPESGERRLLAQTVQLAHQI
jgi:hypothetical protein